jgi:hypothetical protein
MSYELRAKNFELQLRALSYELQVAGTEIRDVSLRQRNTRYKIANVPADNLRSAGAGAISKLELRETTLAGKSDNIPLFQFYCCLDAETIY